MDIPYPLNRSVYTQLHICTVSASAYAAAHPHPGLPGLHITASCTAAPAVLQQRQLRRRAHLQADQPTHVYTGTPLRAAGSGEQLRFQANLSGSCCARRCLQCSHTQFLALSVCLDLNGALNGRLAAVCLGLSLSCGQLRLQLSIWLLVDAARQVLIPAGWNMRGRT